MRTTLLAGAILLCVDGFSSPPSSAAVRQRRRPMLQPQRVARPPHCTVPAAEAPALDLVGDGGVLKQVLQAGNGAKPPRGATVEVHYEGKILDTGAVFDSSRTRGKTFKFTLGEGKVIGGWEVGLSSMSVGEVAKLTCAPQYAYGAKGIPPTIPPMSALTFEVELIGVQAAMSEATTFADDNPTAPRTPESIKFAYESKMAAKPAEKEGIEGFIEWAKGIYIFGLFSTKPEDRPPWYLNPLITFPAIFVIVGVGFYITVDVLNGVHRGTVPISGDDLTEFIGETVVPFDAL